MSGQSSFEIAIKKWIKNAFRNFSDFQLRLGGTCINKTESFSLLDALDSSVLYQNSYSYFRDDIGEFKKYMA